jgi:glycosyltransferase involved in cell wall biosynthesis
VAAGVPHFASPLRREVRPLRVLTLTPFYPSVEGPSQGGFVAEPLRATAPLGISNHVIAVQPFYRHKLRANRDDFSCAWKRYFVFPGNSGLATAGDFLAAALMRTVRALNAEQAFDLIHAHSALPCGLAAMRISTKLHTPFVVSVHGLDIFSTRQAGAAWGNWCRQRSGNVYRQASAVICISQKVLDQVSEGTAARTMVIHNGVDANMFSPGPESSPLTVLSVGNLIPIKDHALLLRAFAQASMSVPGCRLEIMGDGPERGRLVRLANELGIVQQVSFRGRQSRRFVAQAMKRCAVFALPSRYEGLGCVYLEAMASEKPAIGCTGQGIDEVIESGRNGMLISPGSLLQLSEALRTLLINPNLRARLGKAARADILRSHTLEHQAAQLDRLYRECVA